MAVVFENLLQQDPNFFEVTISGSDIPYQATLRRILAALKDIVSDECDPGTPQPECFFDSSVPVVIFRFYACEASQASSIIEKDVELAKPAVYSVIVAALSIDKDMQDHA